MYRITHIAEGHYKSSLYITAIGDTGQLIHTVYSGSKEFWQFENQKG
jgi:hypothetical protein